MQATVSVPQDARSTVVFAHGSGSGRYSPRNQFVAQYLNQHGFATVLADLLTEEEEREDARTAELRFDIGLLAERVKAIVDWTQEPATLAPRRVGLFGASTGAAAALIAAAERPDVVLAVVSRGGRPDLATDAFARVQAPTLLIVGSNDPQVLDLNKEALERLGTAKVLEIVEGATHLFEESGALEQVARLAADWFAQHLTGSP